MKNTNLKSCPAEIEQLYSRVVIIYAGLLFLGITLMLYGGEDGRKFGPIVLLLSIGSLIRRLTRAMWAARDRRQAAAEAARREIVKSERKELEQHQKIQRNLEKNHRLRNTQKNRMEQAEKRRLKHVEVVAESASHLERANLIRKEAERLQSLTLYPLVLAVKEALELPGDHWKEDLSGDTWKSVLIREHTTKRELIVVISPRKQAGTHEIEEMESLRRDEDCDRGKLISVGGFSSRAVRQGSRLPITLMDAHLLADYVLTPGRETPATNFRNPITQ